MKISAIEVIAILITFMIIGIWLPIAKTFAAAFGVIVLVVSAMQLITLVFKRVIEAAAKKKLEESNSVELDS